MLEFVQNFVLANALEFYTAVIATLGVAFWVIDRRSMKAALNVARASEMTTLRLKRQEMEAGVERSFATLQMKCQATRDIWRNHNWLNGPKLGADLYTSKEQKEILHVERAGGSLLGQFKASAPTVGFLDICSPALSLKYKMNATTPISHTCFTNLQDALFSAVGSVRRDL